MKTPAQKMGLVLGRTYFVRKPWGYLGKVGEPIIFTRDDESTVPAFYFKSLGDTLYFPLRCIELDDFEGNN